MIKIKPKNNGKQTERKIGEAWNKIPNSWRMRISDGYSTGERPADEIIITRDFNILNEIKSTDGLVLNLNLVHIHQVRSLVAFANLQDRNVGLITVEFLAYSKIVILTVFSFIKYMQENNTQTISMEEIIKNRLYLVHYDTRAGIDLNRLLDRLKEVRNEGSIKK